MGDIKVSPRVIGRAEFVDRGYPLVLKRSTKSGFEPRVFRGDTTLRFGCETCYLFVYRTVTGEDSGSISQATYDSFESQLIGAQKEVAARLTERIDEFITLQ
jgi:hypothetical protein